MRVVSYLLVGVAAFFVGGATFFAVGQSGAGTKQAESPEKDQAVHAVPREFVIEGMQCQGCADAVHSAIAEIPGVRSVTVSLATKRAAVEAETPQVPDEKILAAIVKAGYEGKSAAAAASESAPAAASGKAPILVNITRGKNDIHAVSMAIGLAQSALKDGRKAAVFLNVAAPVFAAKDLGEELKCAEFPPIKRMLADFIDQGGRVLICEHCTRSPISIGQK